MLEVRDLEVAYGPIVALKGISLEVQPGEIVAVLGANGAGKTTLLRTLSGLLRPRRGSLRFEGRELSQLPPDEIVRLGIAHAPEGRRIFGTLSVEENLQLGAFTRPPNEVPKLLEEAYQLFPRLAERRRQLAGTLSGGEQQMLAVARALMSKPRLLLLDEPSLGLAPRLVQLIFQSLNAIRAQGVTIVLVEQNARGALRLADRAYILETGRVAHQGSGMELLSSPDVQKAYLGGV
jgi:branched-chain amino acid transport system ATP-binding protein